MASPKAVCDRCGFDRPLLALRKEWTGLMVCRECYDPKPAEMNPPVVYPEGLPWPNARPEPPDVILGDNDVQPEDL